MNSNPNSNKFKNSRATGSDRFTGRFDRFTGRFYRFTGRFDRFEIQKLPCNRFTGRFDRFTDRFDRFTGRFDWFTSVLTKKSDGVKVVHRFDRFTGRFDRFDWWALMGRPIFFFFFFDLTLNSHKLY